MSGSVRLVPGLAPDSWIANAVEILAARPRPRLFEIRKLSSITRFDNESQKKVASLPILVLDSRSRFADLSFHSQPWLRAKYVFSTAGCGESGGGTVRNTCGDYFLSRDNWTKILL
jgi:hypothetical protein